VTYEEIIARKSAAAPAVGFDVGPDGLAPHLFPHQRDLVRWALRRGRAAQLAATGLGKTAMELEYARHVAERGRVLILAPLAVGPQIAAEGERFGVDARYLHADDPAQRIVITNYEKLHKFDPSNFVGVILDESSRLKSFDGKQRTQIIEAFRNTPFRLAGTATPAPNDFTELGNHSEFLGLKSRTEMLAEFFVHDGGSTQDWRVKGHAVTPFWRWVATWGAVVAKPSDLGYDDGAYSLPPLRMVEHVVPATGHDIAASGTLFALQARTLDEQRAAKRATIDTRVAKSAEIIAREPGEQFVVWVDLNDEQHAMERALGDDCVSIEGSTPDDEAEEMIAAWLRGEVRCMIGKSSMLGFGLNLQRCHRTIFVGASHSFERTFQAIRRFWRFGQRHEVVVDMVRSELESEIVRNYQRKEADYANMQREMTAHVGAAVRAEVKGLGREWNPYQPGLRMIVPSWLTSGAP